MGKDRDKGRLPDFVPLIKSTLKTPAWRAMSHGARSLYVCLKARYNTKLQNSVYMSARMGAKFGFPVLDVAAADRRQRAERDCQP